MAGIEPGSAVPQADAKSSTSTFRPYISMVGNDKDRRQDSRNWEMRHLQREISAA
jgi:hypothetical protein